MSKPMAVSRAVVDPKDLKVGGLVTKRYLADIAARLVDLVLFSETEVLPVPDAQSICRSSSSVGKDECLCHLAVLGKAAIAGNVHIVDGGLEVVAVSKSIAVGAVEDPALFDLVVLLERLDAENPGSTIACQGQPVALDCDEATLSDGSPYKLITVLDERGHVLPGVFFAIGDGGIVAMGKPLLTLSWSNPRAG